MKKRCGVCRESESKYKCPTCLMPFKTHKVSPCRPVEQAPKQHSHAFDESLAKRRAEEEKFPDTFTLLTPEQLEALDVHEEVQRKVRDERLLAIVKRVDAAQNRSLALEREMKNPEFLEFCDDILEAVGSKEPKDNVLTLEEMLKAHLGAA